MRLTVPLAGVLLWSVAGLAQAPSAATFFRPAPAVGEALPADGLYPRGRQMLFTCYSIKSVHGDWARPGFTAIGPYYGEPKGPQFAPFDNPMDAAAALGVKCLYRVGMAIPFLEEHVTPPDEAIVEALTAQVKAVADRPEIAIWYVTPEELRYWRDDEMHYLQTAADAIRAADPLQRPVMLYEPNNRGAAALAKTLPSLDVSSRGLYANTTGHVDQRAWVRWGVEQMVEAVGAVKPSAAPYAVLWMAGDPEDPADVAMIPRWTRHDVYASLVNGARGIVIWSGFRRAGFTTFEAYLDGYAACADELNGALDLRRAFLFGERRADLRATVVRGPASQQVTIGQTSTPVPTLSFLNAAVGDERYLVMVNSANDPLSVSLSGLPAEGFMAQELAAGAVPQRTSGARWSAVALAPLEVRIWRLTRE